MAKAIKRVEPNERAAIMVPGEAFNKLADIAEMEERDMGGQVAYLVKNLCAHPLDSRIKIQVVVSVVEPATKKNTARVGKDQPFRGFFCSTCGKYIMPELTEAVNAAAETA